MNDDDLKDFLDKHKDLMISLGQCLMCPGCHTITKPPFYNLGKDYNWAEGCKVCYDRGNEEGNP